MRCSNSPKPYLEFTPRKGCFLPWLAFQNHGRFEVLSVTNSSARTFPIPVTLTDHDRPRFLPVCLEIHQNPFHHAITPAFPQCSPHLSLSPQLPAGTSFPHPNTRHPLRCFSDGPQHLPNPVLPDVPSLFSALEHRQKRNMESFRLEKLSKIIKPNH